MYKCKKCGILMVVERNTEPPGLVFDLIEAETKPCRNQFDLSVKHDYETIMCSIEGCDREATQEIKDINGYKDFCYPCHDAFLHGRSFGIEFTKKMNKKIKLRGDKINVNDKY